MISASEAHALVLAAFEAVAPNAVGSSRSSIRNADDLLGWVLRVDVRALLAELSDRENDDLRLVLDGMLRQRTASARRP